MPWCLRPWRSAGADAERDATTRDITAPRRGVLLCSKLVVEGRASQACVCRVAGVRKRLLGELSHWREQTSVCGATQTTTSVCRQQSTAEPPDEFHVFRHGQSPALLPLGVKTTLSNALVSSYVSCVAVYHTSDVIAA